MYSVQWKFGSQLKLLWYKSWKREERGLKRKFESVGVEGRQNTTEEMLLPQEEV